MPAFYPRHNMPRQLPLTPPEFVPSYHSGCGGMPYQQSSYSGQPTIRQHDDGYDFADRYGQLAIAMPPMYPQAGTYLSSAPPSLPPPSAFYDAPILPPMRVQNEQQQQQQQQQQQRVQDFGQRAAQQPKEEKPVGGVSAKLDYDMDVMTDFVCEKALQVITPGRMMPTSFRKWVHQVLCATRLPSATILLSMCYLSTRMPMVAAIPKNDSHLFRMLTIALILGSKFLDDNTFINRSWAEVSGIPVTDLNMMELEWLKDIEFKLHRDPSEQQGWVSWSDHWKEYQSHANARANRINKLNPIDTSVHRRSLNKPLPPLPMQQSFNPPPYEFTPKSGQPSYNSSSNNSAASYSQYDPWRSANDHSPASAPNTGPTTPEYYGAAGPWAPEGYSRRTMFGFPPLSQPAPGQPQPQSQPLPQQQQQQQQQQHHPSNYGPPAYSTQYQAPVWNNHGINCGCMYCAQRHPPYFMAPGFGPQAVAV